MRARSWNARQFALVTSILIGLNVIVFIVMGIADPETFGGRTTSDLHIDLSLVELGFDGQSLRGTATGEWYRIVTSGFVHFGFIHIGFNMFLLYQLGNLLEPALGRVRFALVYAASLLGGSAGVLLLSPNQLTAGASGAVFGLLGAAAVALHQRGVNPFSTGIGTTILLNVIITFTLPGISIGGHVGGLVAGAISGWFVSAPNWRKFPPAVTYGAPVAVAAVALAICFATGSG